jgi:type IV secretory pathway VirB2 component (pilin)
MNQLSRHQLIKAFLLMASALPALAQEAPWTASSYQLRDAFTGPIAMALTLVSIVIGGLLFQFSEGQGKRTLAGIIFGGGMTMGAARFLAWLFPY